MVGEIGSTVGGYFGFCSFNFDVPFINFLFQISQIYESALLKSSLTTQNCPSLMFLY